MVVTGPAQTLTVRYFGRRHRLHRGVLVELNTNAGTLENLTLQLRRGNRIVARGRIAHVGTERTPLVLRRARGRAFRLGRYTLSVRAGAASLLSRPVRVGRATG